MSATELDRLRATDVYLIDQILKGRLDGLGCVVDVGAGAGRNLPWFVGRAERVVALDPRPERTSWLHRSRVEESIPTGTNRLRNRRVPPENGR